MPIAEETFRGPEFQFLPEDNAVGSTALGLRANGERRLANDVRQSIFWATMNLIVDAQNQLRKLATLSSNWDSYGAPAPSATSIENVVRILEHMRFFDLALAKLVPSAEGGIAICFAKGDRYADIEATNDGSILGVRYVGMHSPVLIEVNESDASIDAALAEIREHIRG